MKQSKLSQRLFALLLCMCMVVGLFPVTALASETDEAGVSPVVEESATEETVAGEPEDASQPETVDEADVVTQAIRDVIAGFGFDDETPANDKVAAVYEYVTASVAYDGDAAGTAYAAVAEKAASSEGFAQLVKLLLDDCGVNNTVVSDADGYAWNMVEIDGAVFHLDAAADAGKTEYSYFLTEEHAGYPAAETVEEEPVIGEMETDVAAADGDTAELEKIGGYTYNGQTKRIVSERNYAITQGVTESNVVINDNSGSSQTLGYMLNIDLKSNSNLKLKTIYKGYYNGTDSSKWAVKKWGLAKTSDLAAAYEASTGENVVFATNGDYFNMQTGQPLGSMIMNGVEQNPAKANDEPFFAVLKDGTAVIREAGADKSDVMESVSGPFFLVKDGVNVAPFGDEPYPVNSVGFLADGSVFFFLADGRQYPLSVGMSQREQAEFLIAQGVQTALYLDGGGSATFMTEREGGGDLKIRNSPSDGSERSIASGMVLVSTAAADGEFDHAALTPNNEVYTPGSQVAFEATGVDASGSVAELPESGLTWRLAEASTGLGTIDAATGLFTSNGTPGDVTVELVYGDKLVGSTSICVAEPDELYFNATNLSLDFGESSDLGFVARSNGREIIFKDGDFQWSVTPVEAGIAPEVVGTVSNNIFTAGQSETTVHGVVTVARGELSASINVEIGKMPVVAFDFEPIDGVPQTAAHFHWGKPGYGEYTGNVSPITVYTSGRYTDNPVQSEISAPYVFTGNWDTAVPASDIFAANGYNYYLWPNASITAGNVGSVTLTSADQGGQVRFGSYSMELNYDYASYDGSKNANYYIRYCGKEPYYIEGTPNQMGVWVYADAQSYGYVLAIDIEVWNGTNYSVKNKFLTTATGSSYIDWEGWMYCYTDLSDLAVYASEEHPLAIIPGTGLLWLSYQPAKGLAGRNAGTIYFDNYRFVYGTDLDDLDNPIVDTISVNGTELSDTDTVTINNGTNVQIAATFHDPDGNNRSGISPERTDVIIDGMKVNEDGDENHATTRLDLANGKHSVQINVSDGFGNTGSKVCYFVVNDENAETASARITGADTVTMGTDYVLSLETIGTVKTVSATVLNVNSDFGEPTVTFADGWTGTCDYENAGFKKATMQIHAEYTGEGDVPADAQVATLAFNVPTTIDPTIDFFTYRVVSMECELPDGSTITAAQPLVKLSVSAYYTVNAEIAVSGKDTVLTVVDPDNNPVSGVEVYVNDALVGTTDEAGKITTDVTRNLPGGSTFTVYAKNGNLVSFTTTITVMDVAGAEDGKPVAVTPSASVSSKDTQFISWLSNANVAEGNAVVQYVKQADYNDGNCQYTTVNGTSELHAFNTTKHTAYINTAEITGLQPNTTYCFRVGDGQDGHWSDVSTFKTSADKNHTKFFVIGDTQMSGNVAADAEEIALLEQIGNGVAGYDFGIQTGDYIDNGGNYPMWEEIQNVFQKSYAGMDVIHTLGNHEYYGDVGASAATAIFGMKNRDYYSVEYDNVYVAVINYESNWSEALEWLVADAQASNAEWKVLSIHQPAYYTNEAGGSARFNAMVPNAVDEAGIDVVFSGHDHSYARTEPMTGGQVDKENGATYFICGDLGEKSRNINYKAVDNPDFHFSFISQEYSALYLTVEVENHVMSITARDADGTIIDSVSIDHPNSCVEGHDWVYDRETGLMTCQRCGEVENPTETLYSGWVKDRETGRAMYLIGGRPATGLLYLNETSYAFDENGLIREGEYTIHGETCLFENGLFVSSSTADVLNAGWCGDDIRYILYADGRFYLEGTGEMYAAKTAAVVPWRDYQKSIISVEIGKDITNVGGFSFSPASNCTSVVFEEGSKVTTINDYAFAHMPSLTKIELPEYVNFIGVQAFKQDTNLAFVYLPDRVATIRGTAFSSCNKELLVLSVARDSAAHKFAEKNGYRYILRDPLPIYSGTCGENATWELYSDGVLRINGSGPMTDFARVNDAPWYNYRSKITRVEVGKDITTIGTYAIYNTTATSVNFAEGSKLEKLNNYALYKNPGLTEIVLPDGLKTINANAFARDTGLTSVYLPDNVSYINKNAFAVCDKEKLVLSVATGSPALTFAVTNGYRYVERTAKPIGGGTCGENLTWELDGNGVLRINGSGPMTNFARVNDAPWYDYRSRITSVEIGKDVTTIGAYAIFNTNATSVTFAEGSQLKKLFSYAFYKNIELTEIVLPEGLTDINANAFARDTGLTSVYLPDSVKYISYTAFNLCDKENLVLNVGGGTPALAYAQKYNFRYVERTAQPIDSGSCGESLTWAMYGDGTLKIEGSGEMTDFARVNDAPWYNYRGKITSVEIGKDVTSIGFYAIYGTNATSVTFAEGSQLKKLNSYAFYKNAALTEIVLPEGLKTINANAFARDTSLTSVYLPESLNYINIYAFAKCDMEKLTVNVLEGSYAHRWAVKNGVKFELRG